MTVIERRKARLSQQIGRYRFDPLGFVEFAFPWGRPGTALAGESGPEPWQREVLEELGRSLKQRDSTPDEAGRLAVASGHCIGKSALVSWVVLWALSTLSDTRGIDFGSSADRSDGPEAAAGHANKRAEMWGHMKEWCKVGCLPDDRALSADLTYVDYGYDASDAIRLERKDDMRKRGLASPDDGDPLPLTFAYPVQRRETSENWRLDEKLERLRRYVV
jgi:hypothetical protein